MNVIKEKRKLKKKKICENKERRANESKLYKNKNDF